MCSHKTAVIQPYLQAPLLLLVLLLLCPVCTTSSPEILNAQFVNRSAKHSKARYACVNDDDARGCVLVIHHPGPLRTAASARALGMVPLQPVPGSCSPTAPAQAFTCRCPEPAAPELPGVPTILMPLSVRRKVGCVVGSLRNHK